MTIKSPAGFRSLGRLKSLALGLLALMAAPLAAQPQQGARPVPQAAPAQRTWPAVHARPALWQVRDKDTTIYLFGTIHLLRPNIHWFEGRVKSAFDASQDVVMEVVDQNDTITQLRLAQRAVTNGGPPLTDKLPEEIRPRLNELLAEYRFPAAALNRMKPWYAAVTLTSMPLQRLGYDRNSGVETQLRRRAQEQGKAMIGLETTEQQLGFFEGLSEQKQIELLVETINEQGDVETTLAKMIDAWARGKPGELALNLNKSMEEDAELEKVLLFDRNERWADWIKARLEQPGTVFLAVGAGHLAGKGSLQDALKARRIKARQVKTG